MGQRKQHAHPGSRPVSTSVGGLCYGKGMVSRLVLVSTLLLLNPLAGCGSSGDGDGTESESESTGEESGTESGTESSTESSGSEESSTESSTDESEETANADEDGGGGSCDCRADRNGPDAAGLLGLFGLLWWRRRRGA